jgi:hypothetical protein
VTPPANTDGDIGASFVSENLLASTLPEVKQCIAYWNSLKVDQELPCWDSFDWMKIPLDIIPYCGVVDVQPEPLDFIYRFWGTAHASAMKQELTGKSVKDMLPSSESLSVFGQYEETYNARAPQFFTNTIEWVSEFREMKEYSLRLPFSDDGKKVDKIFAFSDMRRDLKNLTTAFRNSTLRSGQA